MKCKKQIIKTSLLAFGLSMGVGLTGAPSALAAPVKEKGSFTYDDLTREKSFFPEFKFAILIGQIIETMKKEEIKNRYFDLNNQRAYEIMTKILNAALPLGIFSIHDSNEEIKNNFLKFAHSAEYTESIEQKNPTETWNFLKLLDSKEVLDFKEDLKFAGHDKDTATILPGIDKAIDDFIIEKKKSL